MASANRAEAIWTVGHSTRSLQEFLDLLAAYQIELIADVRSLPGSRKFPQYDQDTLADALGQGIGYQWIKALGGRRRARSDSLNTVWRNASFRGYADYMQTADFGEGLAELYELSATSRTALMCAEAVWWRCHRSMVADILCVNGAKVVHILDIKTSKVHPMTSPARVVDGQLTYVPPSNGAKRNAEAGDRVKKNAR